MGRDGCEVRLGVTPVSDGVHRRVMSRVCPGSPRCLFTGTGTVQYRTGYCTLSRVSEITHPPGGRARLSAAILCRPVLEFTDTHSHSHKNFTHQGGSRTGAV